MFAVVGCVLCTLIAAEADVPIVNTVQGQLRGRILHTVSGREFVSFRGVPFAEPPVGNLRFEDPVPPPAWKGIRDATKDGNVCTQYGNSGNQSEDCLVLNVYTPKLPDGSGNLNIPVMVYFHPGGFYCLTGHSLWHGPQYLLDHDIVLVTTNYRLGVLGFLSAQDSVLRGNYGLKDQVQALRWVKENIASFGGNPDNVTIFGYSAGSTSVILHMMSPMSQGLFHRCIAMSASPITTMTGGDPAGKVLKEADIFNCPKDSTQQIVDCLRQIPAKDIAVSIEQFYEWDKDTMVRFGPVIEPDLGDGSERFLTADPTELLLSGNFSHVPLIMGFTEMEFDWLAMYVIQNNTWAEYMTDRFDELAPISLLYERGTDRSRNITRELRKFYLQDQPVTNSSFQGLGQLYSDSIIIFGMYRTANLISRVSSAPVYFYKFSYSGTYSHNYKPPQYSTPYGAVHHDDLMYLFYIANMLPLFNEGESEYNMMKKLTKLWTNFAHFSNPTPVNSTLLDNIKWTPYTYRNLKYMDINSTLRMSEDVFHDRMAVWERLFPLPCPDHS
ncbi:esterase E4 [Anabrus simplex]|uniref:esterase E4 n=1 Tax=Anabrus simplex TaxID=316456 RepID=UPI0035A31F21